MTRSDQIRDEDFSERHDWVLDQAGAQRQLGKQQDDIHLNLMEPIQNALDSNDPGEPNTVEVKLGHTASEPVVQVSDTGNGITKDYNGQLSGFMQGLKAISEKIKRGLQRKGIGMLQYTVIAPKVIITSMDQELIHRIPLYEVKSGIRSWGRTETVPIKEKYKEEFNIHKPGTIVTFFNRDPELPKINATKLIDIATKKWSLRLYDNQEIKFTIDGERIWPTDDMLDHPPKHIQTMTGGHVIRGNLWHDPKGTGRLAVFQDGYLVEYIQFDPREVSGYLECNVIETDSGRRTFDKNTTTYTEFKKRIMIEMKKFPRISPEVADEKSIVKIRDLAQLILNLPKSPTGYGRKKDVNKEESTGDRDADDTTGYGVSPTPEPGRKIVKRKKHTRDNSNQNHIGKDGEDQVKLTSEEEMSKRKKYPDVQVQEHGHHGSNRPLLILIPQQPRAPMLSINNDNEEYTIYEYTKNHQPVVWWRKMVDWLSELDCEDDGEITEDIRMSISKQRVKAWKAAKLYPITRVVPAIEKGLFLKGGRR